MFSPYGYGFGYGGYRFDSGYLWVLIALGLSLLASMWVKSTFNKYSHVRSTMTGAQAARYILDKNGLNHVRIERTPGSLSDHYDPAANVVRLSESTFDSRSAAAVGVAAHEVGHAIQYARHYVPIKLRSALVPVVNLASNAAVPLFLLGLIFDFTGLMWLGIICFGASLIFGLVTLPVEINASHRALSTIQSDPHFSKSDAVGAKHVLTAAASTYLASVFVSLTQLLRYIGMANNSRDRR
ncbi:zinc metallopeptidase [Ileibacterium valens]|uniref:Peptidase n=1 Tax=Ileibacterium valens TaxID=1862668 RepID=A0A1U7NG02_9FIRM|nr:zinc metallopeptidase [Ileibacterium valens]OLU38267.1 hypothetical protein BO224_09455 [Erysipelotrichaceae bacterium NYU-BL-E8]OLU39577.1 hypothetical protein BO222_06455 [Ileibacterium valens]OLU40298.1 hypothetical protein BM735_05820 [Erysipelotrichaceae bacterium NYU-BL-F16]